MAQAREQDEIFRMRFEEGRRMKFASRALVRAVLHGRLSGAALIVFEGIKMTDR